MLNSYQAVIDWLQLPPSGPELREAESHVLHLRDLIQRLALTPTCPIITITGTNGKGTCVHTLSAIFHQAGYRVGRFTSPHLQRYNERICLNEAPISDADFIDAAQQVQSFSTSLLHHFFSLLFLMALVFFRRHNVDILILEVGVGGRLDPCNALDATVLGITSIDLDHQQLLGNTREAIAWEKAQLMRPGQTVVCGDLNVPLSIHQHSQTTGSTLLCINQQFHAAVVDDQHFHWQGEQSAWPKLPQVSGAILSNIAVALTIVTAMADRFTITLDALHNALQTLRLPGRYQCLALNSSNTTLILDVAHNPAAIQHLVQRVRKDWPKARIAGVFGILANKAWYECLALLSTLPNTCWHLCAIADPRALDPVNLAEACQVLKIEHQLCTSITDALQHSLATPPDLILVTGSFRMVGAAMDWLARVQRTEGSKLV